MKSRQAISYFESGLQFIFNKKWRVKKYDDHRFYRALSGAGLKGLDFIGILDNERLVLMEVKNYKIRFSAKPPPIKEKILGSTPTLVDTMIYKIEDTFLAVDTIIKYYQRRWWYTPFLKLFDYLPLSYLLRYEWAYWTYIQRLILFQKEQVDLVLWLEMEANYEDILVEEIQAARLHIEDLLQAKFLGYRVRVCSMENNDYATVGLRVLQYEE